MHAHQVACGVGYNMFLVEADEERLKSLPVWDCEYKENASAAKKPTSKKVINKTVGSKRKGEVPAKRGKKKK